MGLTMKSLDELAILHQTDRATVFTRTYGKPHGYAPIYDACFAKLRHEPIKLLEVGVAGGEGIRMCLDYFDHPDSKIHGIDIVSNTNEWNSPGAPTNARYQFLQGDQRDVIMFACALANWGRAFDIIIEDGGHFADTVAISFECLWPAVKPGGIYAVEDMHVGTTPGTVFVPAGWPNHMDWLRDKMDEMNKGSDIECLSYYSELALFRKRV